MCHRQTPRKNACYLKNTLAGPPCRKHSFKMNRGGESYLHLVKTRTKHIPLSLIALAHLEALFDRPYKSVQYCFTAHDDFFIASYNPQKTEYDGINMIIQSIGCEARGISRVCATHDCKSVQKNQKKNPKKLRNVSTPYVLLVYHTHVAEVCGVGSLLPP